MALGIPGKVQQADDLLVALVQYGEALASPALGFVSGNFTDLLALLGNLKTTAVPAAEKAAREVSAMVADAVGCVQEAIAKAKAINETVVEWVETYPPFLSYVAMVPLRLLHPPVSSLN